MNITSSKDDNFFIPSNKFQGAKNGYIFKNDFKGLGYYVDINNNDNNKKRRSSMNDNNNNNKRIKLDPLEVINNLNDNNFVEMNEKSLRLSFTKLLKWYEKNETEYIKFNTTKGNIRLQQINNKVSKQIKESNLKMENILNNILPVTAYPKLFHIFGENSGTNISVLLKLLLHENVHLSFLIVELFHGMIDPEEMLESTDTFNVFINEFLKQNGIEIIAKNVIRISSLMMMDGRRMMLQINNNKEGIGSDDNGIVEKYNECIENTLLIFENILEIIPSKTNDILSKFPEFLHWLLTYIIKNNNNNNNNNALAYLACEIISIFLLSNLRNRKAMSKDLSSFHHNNNQDDESNKSMRTGMHLLLNIMKPYQDKKENPTTIEEEEFLLTMFSSLVCVFSEKTNQDLFASINGFEMMIQMIRLRNITYRKTFEVIDAAIANHPSNCERFVNAGGLKILFPAYMAKGKINLGKTKIKMKSAIRSQDEECILSIVSCLFFNLKDISYERLLSKFLKHDYEKVHRCIELHGTYYYKCYEEEEEDRNGNDGHVVVDDDELLNDKLDKGLFTLQKVDFILATLYDENRDGLRKCIVTQFAEQGFELDEVSKTLEEYSKILNSGSGIGSSNNNNDDADGTIQNSNSITLFDKINSINKTWKADD